MEAATQSLSSSDANSLTVGWMAQADEPQIRTGASSGSVLKSADHILARLGIDASGMGSEVRMYDEYTAPDVSYYRDIDGLPVFTEWGVREAAIFINGLYQPAATNYSLTLQIAHPKMQGTYSLLSWDEVYARLQELYPEGSAGICCFGEDGSFYQYSISQENGTTSHFYVPSVLFERYVTGVNAAGETVDLGAAYELIPRVTLYPYDYGYDCGEGENQTPEEGMETVIE